MNRKRPYPSAKAAAKGKKAGTEKFVQLMRRRFGFTNLGTWVVRDMRGRPGTLSVHATGRALDLGYTDRKTALKAINWLVENNTALGITLINDYMHPPKGRIWSCDRQAWRATTSQYSRGHWFHVELEPWAADDPVAVARVWASLPRP